MHTESRTGAAGCVRRMRPMLGTFVEIGIRPTRCGQRATDSAYRAVEKVERSLSFQDPDSELSHLNRCHGKFMPMSRIALAVLRLARSMSLASNGLFNCTLGGALVRRGVLPDHGGSDPLDSGVAADIEIETGRARLARPVRITLDGIAKGYAVDRAIAALRRGGVAAGWVNAGGDLRVFGDLTLPVYVRDLDGCLRAVGGLRDAAMATSIVGERIDRRYPARILGTGAEQPAIGVWPVLARKAWRADALIKVAAVAPPGLSLELLPRLGGRLIALP